MSTWETTQIGDCTLYHGRAEDVLPSLPSASVQLIVTDPPYFRVKAEAWDRQWADRHAYLAWLRGLAKEWQRVLTPNGSVYCFAAPQMAAHVEVMLGEVFQVIQHITWRKPPYSTKAEMFDKESCRMFFPASEALIFAEQCGASSHGSLPYHDALHTLHKNVFAPLGHYIAEERIRAGLTRDQIDIGLGFVRTKDPERGTELCRRWEEGSSLPTRETYERLRAFLNTRNGRTDYLCREYEDLRREYEDLRRPFTVSMDVPYTDVWDFVTVPAGPGKHLAEKPLPLLRHMILASSRPGDTVLDCCAGSFSTLDAARECGRKALGIEQDARWYQYGCQRLRQDTLFQVSSLVRKQDQPVQEQLWR
jgi:adenine-specific DNA-methyltransferase